MNYIEKYIPPEGLNFFSEEERNIISTIVLRRVFVDTKRKSIVLDIVSRFTVSESLMKKIRNQFRRGPFQGARIKVTLSKAAPSDEIALKVEENWEQLKNHVQTNVSAARLWMMGSHFNVQGDNLYIFARKNDSDLQNKSQCEISIQRFLLDFNILCDVFIQERIQEEKYNIKEEDRKIVKSLLSQTPIGSKMDTNNMPLKVLLGKVIADPSVSLRNVTHEMKDVVIEGEIFDLNTRALKKGVTMITFGVTDYTNSLKVIKFLPKEKRTLGEMLQNGWWIRAKGPVKCNKYSGEIELNPKDIVIGVKPQRNDTSSTKRVELHLHTKYSSQDALCSPRDVIEQAKKWGHTAVAFTDHGVVQSFPEVFAASKDSGVKPIYGLEAYIFDDISPVISCPPPQNTTKDVFVVVDIETTGLSFDSDEIIEIGAIRISNGQVSDTFSSLVKPSRPLPANITKLTGITGKMVRSAPSIEDVLPSFMRFLGEDVFVAHNASFDAGFINRDCNRLNLPFVNPVLDTLALSRIILADLKNHRLKTVAKRLKIAMGTHHRALDDAKTAAGILLNLFNVKDGIENLRDFNGLCKELQYSPPLNTYHVTILVKNQRGLRRLYELVSISHLNHFYRHPRIPKSLLLSQREDLIIGSGCQAGELYQSILQFSREDRIKEIIHSYDFLEIQPISNNSFLQDQGRVSSLNRLKEINKEIYRWGKKHDKPVVLTGDVHFLNPEDEIYRKILLSAQGFRDADLDSQLYYRTTDEMLSECAYLGEDPSREVVIENTQKIADLVEDAIRPVPDRLFTPKIKGAKEKVIKMTYKQARCFYGDKLPGIVKDRIEKELSSIVDNGYSVIYLVAHKLVDKSMEEGYLVGSRGSVGSSLVATLCGITEVNPLPPHYRCIKCRHSTFSVEEQVMVGPDLPDKPCPKCNTPLTKDGYNIPFEVFMGFKGDKVPDIDLNFSGEYQARAHKYTEELFGKDCVYRAGTISTIAEKTAFGYTKAYIDGKGIDANNIEVQRLARGIIGVKRTTGQHPGGIMVVPHDMEIFEFTPVQHPADDRKSGIVTTHFDYHSISDQLLKLDLLGHDDPTSIKMLEEITGIDALGIPLDEPKTMSIFSSLDALSLNVNSLGTSVGSLGVPEFGTRFVRQMLEDTRPTTFSELVRISGLSHGTDVWLNNAQDLIRSEVATLKDVIATRDDIMIHLIENGVDHKTSFDIMERVRKGKPLKSDQESLLKSRGVKQWFIESCNKIKYLFPKAHAVAYVIMAFRIAYFKVHHPEAFYASFFTTKSDDFDVQLILQGIAKVKDTILDIEKREREATAKEKNLLTVLEVAQEMYLRGINFIPIDLYKSDISRFKVTAEGILPPISTIEGIGATAAKNIHRERKRAPFTSLEDLKNRTRITKNALQILIDNDVLTDLPDTDQISLF